MKLSEDTTRTVSYFFEGKGLDSWCDWEKKKAVILQELPLLRMYLDKEQELEALAMAVECELDAYIDKLEQGK